MCGVAPSPSVIVKNVAERKEMIDRTHVLPVSRQAKLPGISRLSVDSGLACYTFLVRTTGKSITVPATALT